MNAIKLEKIFDELFPILRSITGKGYRKSLEILSRYIKFKKENYKTGKKYLIGLYQKNGFLKKHILFTKIKKLLMQIKIIFM